MPDVLGADSMGNAGVPPFLAVMITTTLTPLGSSNTLLRGPA
jgi:hypothetical protein